MEGSCSVDREFSPHAGHKALGQLGSWPDTGSAGSLPAFAGILDDADPDPLFFVETWTFGVETATRNLHARRHMSDARDTHPAAPPSFHFYMPVTVVEERFRTPQSAAIPTAFLSAWKAAYGVPASSPKPETCHDNAPFAPPDPGQPLTAELACRVLGIAPSSSRQQIKAAYRQLVWRYHPDRCSSDHDQRIATDRMTSINAAYHLLCGPAPTSI